MRRRDAFRRAGKLSLPKGRRCCGWSSLPRFSNLGERVPNDPRNQLWRQFMRAVGDDAPKAFVV